MKEVKEVTERRQRGKRDRPPPSVHRSPLFARAVRRCPPVAAATCYGAAAQKETEGTHSHSGNSKSHPTVLAVFRHLTRSRSFCPTCLLAFSVPRFLALSWFSPFNVTRHHQRHHQPSPLPTPLSSPVCAIAASESRCLRRTEHLYAELVLLSVLRAAGTTTATGSLFLSPFLRLCLFFFLSFNSFLFFNCRLVPPGFVYLLRPTAVPICEL